MGAFITGIEQDNKPTDMTTDCYEVPLRHPTKNLPVVEEKREPAPPKSMTSMTLGEFESFLTLVLDELEKFQYESYVMMANKKVWFDRATAGLFPRFEAVELPNFATEGRPLSTFSGWEFEGFTFLPMTREECLKSFIIGRYNPYMDDDGSFRHFPTNLKKNILVLGWKRYKSLCISTSGIENYWSDPDRITLVPICRLNGVNSIAMRNGSAIRAWLENGLIPENLSPAAQKAYVFLMNIFDDVRDYVKNAATKCTFDFQKFRAKVADGTIDFQALMSKGLGIKFSDLPKVNAKKVDRQNPIELVRAELCNCDYVRANIVAYDEKILTEPNGGHWELFEPLPPDAQIVKLPENEPFFGRPPHMDVKDGIVAIDFGTKSTVVVRRVGTDEKLLRVGEGNYVKTPEKKDYENPTVIELRDYKSFKEAYESREGRPFTEWAQATFSHTAAAVLNDAEKDTHVDSSIFYSMFSDLKQWANDKDLRMYLQDRQRHLVELKPYLQSDEGDFDPIELYAYYLGIYINNMHTGICLEYMFSFPVTYEIAVRERILQSFERGLKKSLPPAILNDEEVMKRFKLYYGAPEPVAYASCALGELKLQPKNPDEKVAYAVFDFGGGTTDFDFGIMSIPANKRSRFVINQCEDFGRGDPYLGGENLLNLIAYEVYKKNLSTMREKQIPFALPYECKAVTGGDTIILKTKEAYVNRKRIAEFLRPFWEENADEIDELFDTTQTIRLYSNTDKKIIPVELKLDRQQLEDCLTERIRRGIDNFFEALFGAFKKPEPVPIHILLAGNSCKSSIVRKLFEEKILETEVNLENILGDGKKGTNFFELHMPLGFKPDADKNSAENHKANADNSESLETQDYERLRTGKTGVAFGLMRCRPGGKDVVIRGIKKGAAPEAPFPFYLGEEVDGCFSVKIGLDVPRNQWTQFTFADWETFEIYYTKEAAATGGNLSIKDVDVIRCHLDEDDVTDDEDVFVYLRKVGSDTIEYAVGREEDFSGDFGGKIYSVRLQS